MGLVMAGAVNEGVLCCISTYLVFPFFMALLRVCRSFQVSDWVSDGMGLYGSGRGVGSAWAVLFGWGQLWPHPFACPWCSGVV